MTSNLHRTLHGPTALRPITLGTLTLAAALLLPGCGKEAPQPEPIVRPVKVITIGQQGEGPTREYPGTIKATQNVEMAFEVPGRITEFPVKEGQWVKKGEVLAKLDARDYEARLDTAKANLRKAQADRNRGLSMYKKDKGAIPRATLDADRREVEVQQAKLREAEKAVEDTILRAPFDGRMARKLVEDFANVRAKQPVLVFQDTSKLEIEVNVPERDFTGAGERVDSPAALTELIHPEVVVSSIPDRTFPAEVKEYTTNADPVTRTFQVRLIFDNPEDATILPGSTAKIQVHVPDSKEIRIPAVAVRADADEKPYVWILDPKTMTVHKKTVELGELTGGDVLITAGLKAGDQVVISGLPHLFEGREVRRYGE